MITITQDDTGYSIYRNNRLASRYNTSQDVIRYVANAYKHNYVLCDDSRAIYNAILQTRNYNILQVALQKAGYE